MFTFKPRRLQKSTQQVKENHPEKIDDYKSPAFVTSDLGERLAERLRETPKDELQQFVDELSALERTLYCGLIHHEAQAIQLRVIYGLTLDTELGDIRHLWTHFEKNYGQFLTEMTAEILVGLPQASDQLDRPQRVICRAVIEDDDVPGKFWLALSRDGRVEQGLTRPSSYTSGSALGVALVEYYYCQGWYSIWQSVDADVFRQHLGRLTRSDVVNAIIQGWRIQQQRDSRGGAHWLKTFVELLGVPGGTLWTMLRERNPTAATWYRKLRVRRELHRFFEKFEDNERLEFWKDFIPDLYDARGDLPHRRLFLDFGTFGLIEFAETGNAAYVYGTDYFREMREMNFRRKPSQHSELKNRERARTRLTHQGQWQPRFRRTIHRYLR